MGVQVRERRALCPFASVMNIAAYLSIIIVFCRYFNLQVRCPSLNNISMPIRGSCFEPVLGKSLAACEFALDF